MPAKKNKRNPDDLEGEVLLKECCRRIRAARSLWDAHRNAACRGERDKAIRLYDRLTQPQKEKVPQQLRVWLRYRSEKYFGPQRTKPGTKQGRARPQTAKKGKASGPKKP